MLTDEDLKRIREMIGEVVGDLLEDYGLTLAKLTPQQVAARRQRRHRRGVTKRDTQITKRDSVAPASVTKRDKAITKRDKAPTHDVWIAYAEAYKRRYGVEPTRNAMVNGQLAQFVARVPVDEAPTIAAFYVAHNRSFYVAAKHAVGALLANAEGLRTEWLSGRSVTDTEARQADQTQARGNVWGKLIAEAKSNETH